MMNKTFSKFLLASGIVAAGVFSIGCSEIGKEPGIIDPEVENPIFFSDFDKAESHKNFGDKKKDWPYWDQFDGWINHIGSGAANVSYEAQKISIRTNQASDSPEATDIWKGSGMNNIFFSTAPNFFIVKNIEMLCRKARITFGAQRYGQGAQNTFLKSDFEVRLSKDGEIWSQPLEYAFEDVNDKGNWMKAIVDFTLPEGVKTLCIKFVAKASSVNRIDDLELTSGDGGQTVIFGADNTVKLSSIKDVIAGDVDHIYKIQGNIIATHDKGFLVKDETGEILVFKKKHEQVIGSSVEIEGVTTEYGGMKQFGETSEIKLLATGNYTQPEPQIYDAAKIEAYMSNPSIEYITFEGVENSVRDNIYQWHNNVTIEGTDIIGAIMYPPYALNMKQYDNKKIRVTGYAIGASRVFVAKDTYKPSINVMVVSIEEVK